MYSKNKIVLTLIPIVIVFLIVLKSRKYDDAYFVPPKIEAGKSLVIPEKLAGWQLEGGQWFPESKMFEKINGRATLYEQFGVEGLFVGAWIKNDAVWDMYLFVMKDYEAANGVYLKERPGTFTLLEKGNNAFSVPGASTLHSGKFYIQLVSLLPDSDVKSIAELSDAIIKSLPVEKSKISEEKIDFKNSIPGSDQFFADNAFGFSSLKNVKTFDCIVENTTATWFTISGSKEVLEKYKIELEEYGGKNIFKDENLVGGEMFGNWELLSIQNNKIIGIRKANSKEILLSHYEKWKTKLKK